MSGGASSSSSQSNPAFTQLPGGTQNSLFDMVNNLIGGFTNAPQVDPRQIQDFTPIQQDVLGVANNQPTLAQSAAVGGMNAIGDILTGQSLGNAIQSAFNPLIDNFNENVLGGIRDDAVRAGAVGSTALPEATAQAGQDFSRQLGDVASNLVFQNEQNRLGALSQIPALINSPLESLQAVFGLGEQQRQLQEQQLNLDRENQQQGIQEQQTFAQLLSQLVASILSGSPQQVSESSSFQFGIG